MRKLNYLFVALMTMLLVASCSQDDTLSVDTNSSEAMVSFNLELPDSGPQSRAIIGDGNTVNQLVYEVYQVDANDEVKAEANPVFKGKETAFDNDRTAKVNLSLLKGKSYQIAFWAEVAGTDYYDTEDLRKVTVKYEGGNNDESRDAFFAAHSFTVTSDAKIDVELNRPFAQINVGVTEDDFNNADKAGLTVSHSSVVIKNAAKSINLLDGTVNGTEEVSYDIAAIPSGTLNANEKEYTYLSMSYILVGEEKATLEGLSYVFADNEKADGETVTLTQGLTSVPVQRNYRTNIVGKLLTGDIDFTITIDEIFEGNHEGELFPFKKGSAVATAALIPFTDVNAFFGNVNVDLTLNHENKSFEDVTDLKIELFNGENLLATNTLIVNQSGNIITSPFLTGRTEDLEIWAWRRGAYPLAEYVPTAEELPTKVVATYTIDGQVYVSETDVTVAPPVVVTDDDHFDEGAGNTYALNMMKQAPKPERGYMVSVGIVFKEWKINELSSLKISLYKGDKYVAASTLKEEITIDKIQTSTGIYTGVSESTSWTFDKTDEFNNGQIGDIIFDSYVVQVVKDGVVYEYTSDKVEHQLPGNLLIKKEGGKEYLPRMVRASLDTPAGSMIGYSVVVHLEGEGKEGTFDGAKATISLLNEKGEVMQTNTRTNKELTYKSWTLATSFDVSGNYDYVSDGYWTTDGGIKGIEEEPTSAFIKIELANGKKLEHTINEFYK